MCIDGRRMVRNRSRSKATRLVVIWMHSFRDGNRKSGLCTPTFFSTYSQSLHKAFFKKESSSGLTWPPNARVGQNLKDLIERLLDPDPTNRLGYDGASNIANHPWLSSIDWEKMLGRHYLVRVMLF